MNKILLICFLIGTSLACNNYCNGHGKCGAQDKCTCFMGWGGADCSLRSCPYDDAFVDLPLGDINHDRKVDGTSAENEWRPKGGIAEDLSNYVSSTRAHRYAECSNAGLCDRNSGECVCFDGYEGSACQRRSCPNVDGKVCSGHGSCLTSTSIIHDNGGSYYGWESEKYLSCVCDKEWEGIDCSMRKCPKGLDPVVANAVTEFTYTYTATSNDLPDKTSYFQISYDGVAYQTGEIGAAPPTCNGGKIVDASVSSQYTESVRLLLSQTVSGLSSASVRVECDNQNIKMIISLPPVDFTSFDKSTITSCTAVNTCTTGYTKVPTGTTVTEYLCSRRGLCKSDTGECECFNGYTGEACQKQQSIAL